MARLGTLPESVCVAVKIRTEGMGIRAAGRILEKSHATIIRWQKRLATKQKDWSPRAPAVRR
jgi:transposase